MTPNDRGNAQCERARARSVDASYAAYDYDLRNLVRRVTDNPMLDPSDAANDSQLIQIDHDPSGFRNQIAHPGGATITLTPTDGNRIDTIKAQRGTTTYLDLAYGYVDDDTPQDGTNNDASGPVATIDNLTDDTRWTYTYDHQQRLETATKVQDPDGTDTTLFDQAYGYDGRSNRTTVTDNVASTTETWTYNAADQITLGGFDYDGRGNRTTGGGITATYNDRSQTTTFGTD